MLLLASTAVKLALVLESHVFIMVRAGINHFAAEVM
jgi:hypothetical protein